jgi:ATP-dependent protease ClpP protease subunit
MPDVIVDGKIILHGFVGGGDDFWGFGPAGFDALSVVRALATLGRSADVEVHINSGGGIADEGIAIYNSLVSHKGKVTVYVDAIAGSAASLIAMAGDEIVMQTGTMLMVHNPATFTSGTKADHEKAMAGLEAMAASMADVYAEQTGAEPKAMRKLMDAETWLTAADAVDQKFATALGTAPALEVAAFPYGLYAHAPQQYLALADAKGWKRKETTMTDPVKPPITTSPAADLVETCVAAGYPMLAALLIRDNATPEAVTARITAAKEITGIVATAIKICDKIDPKEADAYIIAGASPEKVKADLYNKVVAIQQALPKTTSTHQAGPDDDAAANKAMTEAVVAKINKRNKAVRR